MVQTTNDAVQESSNTDIGNTSTCESEIPLSEANISDMSPSPMDDKLEPVGDDNGKVADTSADEDKQSPKGGDEPSKGVNGDSEDSDEGEMDPEVAEVFVLLNM